MDAPEFGETRFEETPSSAPEPVRWGRRDAGLVALLLALTLAHWLPRLSGPIDLRYDGAVYYVLGTSLARGEGYRLLNEPGAIEAIQYPPLLPAGIALLQRLLGSEDPRVVGQALRWTYFGLSLAYVLAAYALARRHFRPGWAFCAALIPSLGFHTLYLEDLCFAELPFAVATLAFFLAAGARARWLRGVSALLAAAAFFLRTAGVALLAAWALEALLARHWRALGLRTALGALCVLAWQVHVARVRGASEYRAPAYEYQRAPYQFNNVSYTENVALLDPFAPEKGSLTSGALAARILRNAGHLWLGIGESVSVPRGYWEWPLRVLFRAPEAASVRAVWCLPLLLGLAVALGAVRLARAGERLVILYVLGSVGLIALLPWSVQLPRYLVPLAPFLALALIGSLEALARGRRRTAASVCATLLTLQTFVVVNTLSFHHRAVRLPGEPPAEQRLLLFEDAREWRAFYAGLEWLREHVPPGARIATTLPQLVWLHTGRLAVLPPFEDDPHEAGRLLETVPVDYLVVDALPFIAVNPRYVEPLVRARPADWERVHAAPDGLLAIYRRVR